MAIPAFHHLPVDYPLTPSPGSFSSSTRVQVSSEEGSLEELRSFSRYINLGEWINYFSYAVFDGKNLELKYYGNPTKESTHRSLQDK